MALHDTAGFSRIAQVLRSNTIRGRTATLGGAAGLFLGAACGVPSGSCGEGCPDGYTCYFGACVLFLDAMDAADRPGEAGDDGREGPPDRADADSSAEADADADTDTDRAAEAEAGCTTGSLRCAGDALERCTAGGVWETLATCPLGCVAAAGRCAEIVPSDGIDPAWVTAGVAPLAPAEDIAIDTDTGAVTVVATGAAVPGVVFNTTAARDCGGGSPVGTGVFSFSEIDIADGVAVRVTGTRALALVSSGPVTVAGLIDARGGVSACGSSSCAGSGGFAGGLAGDVTEPGGGPGGGGAGYNGGRYGNEAGGGGGGSCGSGGPGGSASAGEAGGSGGDGYLAAALDPLCGGSGGGAGGYGWGGSAYASGHGGGGGGAVQIVSAVSVTFRSTAPSSPSGVNAGGAGGEADHFSTYDDGGGGGGGGGAILVEAPAIVVDSGAVLAAGGGGGGGGYNGGADSVAGADGLPADSPAPGGSGTFPGGAGGAGATVDGGSGTGGGDGAAGGGGGAGRIRLDSRAGRAAVLDGTFSPHAGSACFSEGTVGSR
jgi:hypothetical protein